MKNTLNWKTVGTSSDDLFEIDLSHKHWFFQKTGKKRKNGQYKTSDINLYNIGTIVNGIKLYLHSSQNGAIRLIARNLNDSRQSYHHKRKHLISCLNNDPRVSAGSQLCSYIGHEVISLVHSHEHLEQLVCCGCNKQYDKNFILGRCNDCFGHFCAECFTTLCPQNHGPVTLCLKK